MCNLIYPKLKDYEIKVGGCKVINLQKILTSDSIPFKYILLVQDIMVFYESLFGKGLSKQVFNEYFNRYDFHIKLNEFIIPKECPLRDIPYIKVSQNREWLLDRLIEEEYECLKELNISYRELAEVIIEDYVNMMAINKKYKEFGETEEKCKEEAILAIGSLLYLYYGEPEQLKSSLYHRIEKIETEQEDEEIEIRDENKIVQGICQFNNETSLRKFIVKNLKNIKINGKHIKLYFDTHMGITGEEYRTPVGNIDILAVDNEQNYYVIELKVRRGTDLAVAQVLRYKGYIEEKLADGRKVFPVIIALEISEKAQYALKHVSDIILLEYDIDFKLNNKIL